MPWAKLDDSFWMHPKVVRAGNEVAGIYCRILSRCAKHRSDGLITVDAAISIAGSASRLASVVDAGLLLPDDDEGLMRVVNARFGGFSRVKLPRWLRASVIERDGYICGLCGGDVPPQDVHIDHIVPVSRGGDDAITNLQVAHSTCNTKKGNRV